MEKNFETVALFDIYAPLLTKKQQRLCDMYYNQDYSLSEIAHIENSTRQAAMDGITKARQKLFSFEQSLKISEKRKSTLDAVNKTSVGVKTKEQLIGLLLDIWE